MDKSFIKKLEQVEYAIKQHYEGSPFNDFCDLDTLISVCDHFIKNYHKSMKMSDQQRALEEYYRTDVDF